MSFVNNSIGTFSECFPFLITLNTSGGSGDRGRRIVHVVWMECLHGRFICEESNSMLVCVFSLALHVASLVFLCAFWGRRRRRRRTEGGCNFKREKTKEFVQTDITPNIHPPPGQYHQHQHQHHISIIHTDTYIHVHIFTCTQPFFGLGLPL